MNELLLVVLRVGFKNIFRKRIQLLARIKKPAEVEQNYGKILTLPIIPCGVVHDNFSVTGFTRTKFPIRLCFFITTNKAQGQSLAGKLVLDLLDACLSDGQLYVYLSRTTHPPNFVISTSRGDGMSINVAYPEVLSFI